MLRIRWYFFFGVLALLDVVVIMLSLQLHRQTFTSVEHLIESATMLEEQEKWLNGIQQSVLEKDAPGNNVFNISQGASGLQAIQKEYVRFTQARARLDDKLDAAGDYGLTAGTLRNISRDMAGAAEEVFEHMRRMSAPNRSAEERHADLAAASKAMARMDDRQKAAIRETGLLLARNAAERNDLLHGHEASLQSRVNYERYFIAAVAALLFCLLWFGYRLQKTSQALEAQRQALLEERRERLAAIGELCSSVAHGIRNPLAAMRSSAQLTLELGILDQDSRRRLRDILDEGSRLGDRVSGMLSLARVSTEAFAPVSLQAVVASAVSELDPEIHQRGLSVEQDLERSEIVIHGDQRQLAQAVIELLSNAMEHASQGSVLRVSCLRPQSNGLARITVENDGPRVPTELRLRVFDLFFTTKPHGTGIGLASVKRTARLHGGDCELVCPASGGARFILSLPVATSQRDSQHAARKEEVSTHAVAPASSR